MKKLITILIAGLFTLASYGQSGVAHYTGIKLGDGAGATTAYNLVSTNSYVIEKVGSTYYARPGIGTNLTAYSGANPTVLVQSAMDASSGGKYRKTIYFKNYIIGMDSLAFNHDSITFDGPSDRSAGLQLKASYDLNKTRPRGFIWLRNSKHIIIKNLTIDGNKSNQTKQWSPGNTSSHLTGIMGSRWEDGQPDWYRPDYFLMENCTVQNFTQDGVDIGGANGIILRDCTFKDNDENNFSITQSCTNTLVTHCVLEGSNSVSGTIMGDAKYANNTVEHCDVRNASGSTGTAWGLGMEAAPHGCKIIDCTIIGSNFKTGIGLGIGSRNCEISGNRIFNILGSSGTGILVHADSGSVIKNNIINQVSLEGFGIALCGGTKMVIDANYSSSLLGTASLYLSDWGGLYSTNNIIKNNTFTNLHGFGINIETSNNNNIFLTNIVNGDGWGDVTNGSTGTIWNNNWGVKTGGILYSRGVNFSTIPTVTKIIGGVGVTGCDFNFATAANVTEQVINLGAIVPAGARILNVSTYTTEVFTGATSLVAETGSASSGAQFIASATIYAANAVTATAAGGVFIAAPLSTATTIYVSATPGANWSGVTAGKMTVYVTYIPYN